MRKTPRTARNGTIAALTLPLTLSVLIIGTSIASAGTGQLSLDVGQTELTIKQARTSTLGEAVLAGLLLASALASLAWLRSRQTRIARARATEAR